MKRLIYLIILLSFSTILTHAQDKIVKYCEIDIQEVGLSGGKFRVELFIGKVDSLFSPQNINVKNDMQKVKSLSTAPDVLNYMSSLGWSLVTVTGITGRKYLYFKKEFKLSDLNDKISAN